ncbi:cytochrome P450 [Cubamyces menziesii]|nr:cytochrome P450 [Cubamyces menziesii]
MVADFVERFANLSIEDAAQQEQIAKNVAASTVEGGLSIFTPENRKYVLTAKRHAGDSDTTYSTIEGLFLALSLYPEVQRKAQAELDAVVNRERLPGLEDRHALVYINAVVKEALRWHNVVPLGVTHCTLEDDELHGYFIPAGTSVVPNVWYDCAVQLIHYG